MSKELREAAERTRKHLAVVTTGENHDDSPYYRIASDGEAVWMTGEIAEDESALACAYLAEHPADDEEPVTPKDMEAFGFGDSAHGRDEKRFEICPGVRVLFFACAGPKCWNGSIWIGANKNIDNPTRGDVRRLCRALGITLKETT